MSDVVIAVAAAACMAILAFMGKQKRLVIGGVLLIGLYLTGVQAYRTYLTHQAVSARLGNIESHQDPRIERAAIKKAIMAIIERGAIYLSHREILAYRFATATVVNSHPLFDLFLCEQIRSDAAVYREKALNQLPGEDKFGGAHDSYAMKDCAASLPPILAELNSLAQKL